MKLRRREGLVPTARARQRSHIMGGGRESKTSPADPPDQTPQKKYEGCLGLFIRYLLRLLVVPPLHLPPILPHAHVLVTVQSKENHMAGAPFGTYPFTHHLWELGALLKRCFALAWKKCRASGAWWWGKIGRS